VRPAKLLSLCIILTISQLLFYLPFAVCAPFLSVNLEENSLSVTAENIALQTILRELAAQGITVKIDPAINPLISANFKTRPLEQALESLLKPASYSLLWQARSRDADNPSVRLAEIQVFQTGKKDRMQTLPPRRIGVITKNKAGIFYVKDEILLYIPPGTDLAELQKVLLSYKAILVENTLPEGLVRILLPENSDVLGIAREIKNRLGLDISQPNYAYPIQPPVLYATETPAPDIAPGSYVPADTTTPIAILDSGLADNDVLDPFVVSSLDMMSPETPITDTVGHGTQMAYIASGLIKPFGSAADNGSYIPIIPIRTFDDNGYTTDFTITAAINFALTNNARVLSLSWGSETRSAWMEKAFAYAHAKGLIIVASAGNAPTGKPVYPAAYPSVIGVGALGPHGETWENSNYGNFVALYAPGFANLPVGHKGEPGLYAGTSIAAAFVANAIAGYLSQNPAATPQEIRDYLNEKF